MHAAPLLPNLDSSVNTKPHAHSLDQAVRSKIALKVISGGRPTHVAKTNGVSRKFVYKQVDIARNAVDKAFTTETYDDEKVLFTVAVTKTLLRRMIIALLLRCHAPYRGVIAFLQEVFGYSTSLGTIHNIVHDAIVKASAVNSSINLENVKTGLHDEIYQNGLPVLVGVDAHSMFCYLLASEESCDGTSWGCRLLDLQKKGFAPDSVVADQGKGHRTGFKEVFPNTPCFIDVFHILKDFGDLIRFYENKHTAANEELRKIDEKMKSLQRKQKKQTKFSRSLGVARANEQHLSELVFALKTLFDWLRRDILAIAGPHFEVRLELLNFVIDELRARESKYSKVTSFWKKLENVKTELLGFVDAIDSKLKLASAEHDISIKTLEKIAIMLSYEESELHRYEIEAEVRSILHDQFYKAITIVKDILASTPRASSLVESVNSLLRNYFFLRREIGHGYLELLQFYLNHRVLLRSDRSHRTGKTPREILTGEKHENWLDILGFPKVKRAA